MYMNCFQTYVFYKTRCMLGIPYGKSPNEAAVFLFLTFTKLNYVYNLACQYLVQNSSLIDKIIYPSGWPENGTTAIYECKTGYYTLNSTTSYCSSNLTWNGTEPTCIEVECNSSVDILNGVHYPNVSRYVYKDIVYYLCDTGYYLAGNASIHCTSSGMWNATLPSCQVIDCKNITIDHAWVNYTNGTMYLSEAYIECDIGFNISGASYLTCNDRNVWSPGLPYCNVISK